MQIYCHVKNVINNPSPPNQISVVIIYTFFRKNIYEQFVMFARYVHIIHAYIIYI